MDESASMQKRQRARDRSDDLEHVSHRSSSQSRDIAARRILHRKRDVKLVLVNPSMYSKRPNDIRVLHIAQ
jgi:hypothetical protein